MFVLRDIHIDTHTEIRGTGLVSDMRHLIIHMIGLAHTQFHNGEILVVKVESQCCLILSVVAKLHLSQTHQVGRDGKTPEERDRVLLQLQEALSRCGKQRQVEDDKRHQPQLTS